MICKHKYLNFVKNIFKIYPEKSYLEYHKDASTNVKILVSKQLCSNILQYCQPLRIPCSCLIICKTKSDFVKNLYIYIYYYYLFFLIDGGFGTSLNPIPDHNSVHTKRADVTRY